MRLGVFGGTFDPPHLGHAMVCLWAVETGEVDRVIVVPVAQHAFGKAPGAPFEHRFAMCRLAVARLSQWVEVCDIEARRDGISYMIDTLRQFADEHPGDSFRLLVGSDVAKEIDDWREADAVRALAPILEVPRPLKGERFDDRPGALPPISSSDVRRALADGRATSHFLSADVRDYIEQNGLYC